MTVRVPLRWIVVTVAAGLLLAAVAVILGWKVAAGAGAAVGAAALAGRLRRQGQAGQGFAAGDAAVDATRAQEGVQAGQGASRAAGSGWTETPVRKRPRLPVVPLLLLPWAARAELPACLPTAAQVGAPAPGFGLWVDETGSYWCPCLREYGEVNRLPAGCASSIPLVGYTLEAHVGVEADIARATVLVEGLQVDLRTVRGERDEQATNADTCSADLLRAQVYGERWVTGKTVLATVVGAIVAGVAVWITCNGIGC